MKSLRNCGITACLLVVLVFFMFNCGQNSEQGSLEIMIHGLERVQEGERIELILAQNEEIRRREFCDINEEDPVACSIASIEPGTYCLITKLLTNSNAILGENCQQQCGITIRAGETTEVDTDICVSVSENPNAGNLDVGITIVEEVVEVDSGVILRVLNADVLAGGTTLQLPIMLYPDSQALPTGADFNVVPIANGLTLTNVTAGRSAREAEKQVQFNADNDNQVVIIGINRTPILGGELVILTIEVSPDASGSLEVCLSDPTVTNAQGDDLLVDPQCGTVNIIDE